MELTEVTTRDSRHCCCVTLRSFAALAASCLCPFQLMASGCYVRFAPQMFAYTTPLSHGPCCVPHSVSGAGNRQQCGTLLVLVAISEAADAATLLTNSRHAQS